MYTDLTVALEYETLQEQYNKLQQLFNEISEKNTALRRCFFFIKRKLANQFNIYFFVYV